MKRLSKKKLTIAATSLTFFDLISHSHKVEAFAECQTALFYGGNAGDYCIEYEPELCIPSDSEVEFDVTYSTVPAGVEGDLLVTNSELTPTVSVFEDIDPLGEVAYNGWEGTFYTPVTGPFSDTIIQTYILTTPSMSPGDPLEYSAVEFGAEYWLLVEDGLDLVYSGYIDGGSVSYAGSTEFYISYQNQAPEIVSMESVIEDDTLDPGETTDVSVTVYFFDPEGNDVIPTLTLSTDPGHTEIVETVTFPALTPLTSAPGTPITYTFESLGVGNYYWSVELEETGIEYLYCEGFINEADPEITITQSGGSVLSVSSTPVIPPAPPAGALASTGIDLTQIFIGFILIFSFCLVPSRYIKSRL